MTDLTIRKSVILAADRATVWAHLTRSDLLAKWFHPSDADLSDGADYVLTSQEDGSRMCWGRVEEMRPMDYMRWTFTVGPLNGVMTTVEWWLEDAGDGIRLSLAHSGLPQGADGFGLIRALDKGWHGFFLNLHEI